MKTCPVDIITNLSQSSCELTQRCQHVLQVFVVNETIPVLIYHVECLCAEWGVNHNEPYLPIKRGYLGPIESPTAHRVRHVIHIRLHTLIATWESLSFKH